MERADFQSQVSETGINLAYLQIRLTTIDLLVQRAVRLWQAAGQNPEDNFRGLTISIDEALLISGQPFGTNWGHLVELQPGQEEVFNQAFKISAEDAEEIIAVARTHGFTLRLDKLQREFKLDQFDLNTLLTCLAPAIDLRYERLYGFLQDDVTHKRPTVNLVLNLLAEPGLSRLQMLTHFGSDSVLLRSRLLNWASETDIETENLLGQALQIHPTVVAWLLGQYQPGPDLEGHIHLLFPEDCESDRLLAAAFDTHINLDKLPNSGSRPPILVFYGPDQASQNAAARQSAARFGRGLLQIDIAAINAKGGSLRNAIRDVLRDARLTGALPYFTGWDACLLPIRSTPGSHQGEGGELSGQYSAPPWLMEELFAYPDLMIISGRSFWQISGFETHQALYWLEFPLPDYRQRQEIWKQLLTASLHENNEGEFDLAALAGQFTLTGEQIRDAISWARDMAAQHNRALNSKDLFLAARVHSNSSLGNLAHKIEPRYAWTDIILPDDRLALLREIVATVRSRPLVLEGWEVGRKLTSSAGIPILFSGPPGTGKTMAAEVIANELNLDLYKIDLSTVVSKYIGETEKNLESIFNEAESSNAILFFDEADAIFGKRSEVKDAHDRYANIEISFLLQRMERYNGIVILATNLRANLDDAFTRRLQFVVDFPFPDEIHRLRIWQTLFPVTVPREADLDFGLLARQFKLAGGNIRNIIVGAAYLAAADGLVVNMDHVKHSIRRELQKMGRLVNEKEMKVLGEVPNG